MHQHQTPTTENNESNSRGEPVWLPEAMPASLHDLGLKARLAAVLPEGVEFSLHHISTPPTICPAIYAPPPRSKPEKTYCESHFLAVAVRPDNDALSQSTPGDESGNKPYILVFAIEVLIYTTLNLTTLFVSKADSTGYIHLLKRPLGSPSPLKAISTTFLSHLVDTRQRPGVKLVVSLFARAQGQYLFPGSVHNSDKHVMNDRGLVRWWCGVLDPILEAPRTNEDYKASSGQEGIQTGGRIAKGYLLVPGFDKHETFSLLPPSVKVDPLRHKRWVDGHPLLQISSNPNAPPKCLIPHFPDDPKSRYMDELDGEISESHNAQIRGLSSGHNDPGQWKSVRSLDQFWEMMAFRQECSAGRIVGFIWVVFDPIQGPVVGNQLQQTASVSKGLIDKKASLSLQQSQTQDLPYALQRPGPSHAENYKPLLPKPLLGSPASKSSRNQLTSPPPNPPKAKVKSRKLSGPIYTRQPRIKVSISRPVSSSQPSQTPFYTWPLDSRGQVVLDEKDYARVNDLLLRLEFSTKWLARRSTKRYVDEVSVIAGLEGTQKDWGHVIVGQKTVPSTDIHVLKASSTNAPGDATSTSSSRPNVLSDGLVRKRPKLPENEASSVNLLGSGLVRKKPKV
jgi:regulator of Ty1 transposition protein 109